MAGLTKQSIDTEEEDTDTSDPIHVLNEDVGDDEPDVVDQQPLAHPSSSIEQLPSTSHQKKNALDRFLMGYVEFMSSAVYQDRGLKLLQWTLWLASKLAYAKKSSGREALYKLSIDLSFARYALRLLGLPSAVEACRNDSWGSGWLGRTMALSMVGYYPLEHLAWAKWMVPSFFESHHHQHPHHHHHRISYYNNYFSAAKLSAWSCRCWFVYLMAELLDGLRNLQQLQAAKQKLLLTSEQQQQPSSEERTLTAADDDNNTNTNNHHDAQLAQMNHSIRHQQLQVARDLLFTVPCIQWSLPNWDTQPWLDEWIINGLMWLESVVCMYQSVQAFNNSKKKS